MLPPSVPLYAVGGANPDNFGEYFAAGCAGFGLGTAMLGDALGVPERAGAAHVILEQAAPFGIEARVLLGRTIGGLHLEDEGHQRLGHIAAAETTEAAGRIRAALVGVGLVELVQLGIPEQRRFASVI